MAWQIILPIVASILQGGIGSALSANAASQENNRNRLISQARRAELQPLIERLKEARDYFGVEEQFTRDFSRASNQMAAQSAQTGMTNAGSGGLDQVRGDMLASGLAQLAQYKTGVEQKDERLLAEILSDPSLYGGVVPEENTGRQTLLGALGGGAAGLGSVFNSFLSTPEGMQALGISPGTQNVDYGESTAGGWGDWLASQAAGQTSQPAASALPGFTPSTRPQGGPASYSPAVYQPSRGNPYYTLGR